MKFTWHFHIFWLQMKVSFIISKRNRLYLEKVPSVLYTPSTVGEGNCRVRGLLWSARQRVYHHAEPVIMDNGQRNEHVRTVRVNKMGNGYVHWNEKLDYWNRSKEPCTRIYLLVEVSINDHTPNENVLKEKILIQQLDHHIVHRSEERRRI